MSTGKAALILFIFLSATGCTFLYPSKTPAGVDISPIVNLNIEHKPVKLSDIAKHIPGRSWHKKNSYEETLVFHYSSSEIMNRVFRSVNIYQLNTETETLAKYNDLKSSFTGNSEDQIYQEENTHQEKYIITYKSPYWDSNHGIPTHINSRPDITIIIKKDNLIILISYSSYLKKDDNYINTINKDIFSTYELLEKYFRQQAALNIE